MKKYTLLTIWLIGTILFASCNSGSEKEQQTSTTNTESVGVVAPDTAISEAKQELLKFAAHNNIQKVELGKLAISRGVTANARQFGQQLVDWYNQKHQDLQKLAQHYGVDLPTAMEEYELKHVQDLQKAKDENFDREFWDTLIDAQEEAIREFDKTLKDVEKSDATSFSIWAQNTLKELHAQTVQARKFKQDLKNRR